MSSKGNKFAFLAIGLVAGLIAGAVVIWLLNRYQNNNVDFFTSDEKPLISGNQAEKDKDEAKKDKELWVKFNDHIDTTSLSDGMSSDSTFYSENDEENIIVSRDELLFVKYVKVSGGYSRGDENGLDTLLTDSKNPAVNNNNVIHVEFWRSPINYKGFKFDGIRLILFGIYEYDHFSLLGYDQELFVKYNKEYYHIIQNSDFSPLNPLREAALIRELNSL